jgi:carboxylesterase
MLREVTARTLLPFDPDTVAPWSLGGGPRGALLLHGFAGTPPELRRLGEYLSEHGWSCVAPALAGHAATPADLASTRWEDWVASAQESLDELAERCSSVVVAGQSMGGTIALHLAATDLRIRAVATLAAPIWIRVRFRRWLHLASRVRRWHYPRSDTDLYLPDAVEELHSYGKRSMSAIAELFDLLDHASDELAMVRAPVFIAHGARDSVVDPRNAGDIAKRLVSSAEVNTRIYERSGHALSVDVDRDEINRAVLAWFDRFVPAAANPGRAAKSALATSTDISAG